MASAKSSSCSKRAAARNPMATPRLDSGTRAHIHKLLRNAVNRAWCKAHGKTLPPPKLPPVVLRIIKEWFVLVDDDGSGTLEHCELLAALQAARIPCDADSITEMIRLIDANRDGCISWSEFEAFMMNEFAAGQQLLSGEFVLPSGMALPFGDIIRQLKRSQMIKDVTEGGEARRKWLHADIDLTAAAAEIARAEEAIRIQKEYNETLHTALPQQQAGDAPGRAGLASSPRPGARSQQCGRASEAAAGLPGSAAAAPRAPPQAAAPCSAQERPHASPGAEDDLLAPAAAASDTAGLGRTWLKPASVPRLKLAPLTAASSSLAGQPALDAAACTDRSRAAQGSAGAGPSAGGSSGGGSSRQPVGFLTEAQPAALLARLPASARGLVGYPACLYGASQPSTGDVAPAGGSSGRPCFSVRCFESGSSSSSTGCSARAWSHRPTAAAAATAAKPGAAGAPMPPAASSSSGSRPSGVARSTSAGGGVAPQPSRDEWRAVAASCLTHRRASACRAAAASGDTHGQHQQQQQQQHPTGREDGSSHGSDSESSSLQRQQQQQQAAQLQLQQAPALNRRQLRLWSRAGASPASSGATARSSGAEQQCQAGAPLSVSMVADCRQPLPTHRGRLSVAAASSSGSRAAAGGGSGGLPGCCSPYAQQPARATRPGHTPQGARAAAGQAERRTAARRLAATPGRAASAAAVAAQAASSQAVPVSNDDSAVLAAAGPQGCAGAHSTAAASKGGVAGQACPSGGPSSAAKTPRTVRQAAHAAGGGGAGGHQGPSCVAASRSPARAAAAAAPSTGRRSTCGGRSAAATPRGHARGPLAQQQQRQYVAGSLSARPSTPRPMEDSVLAASCKHLLSVRAVPPSALLSQDYVGPVEAAAAVAHTPRSLR